MKKIYLKIFTVLILAFSVGPQNIFAQAGTASASSDTICVADMTTLILSAYSGSIQWQSLSGAMWTNETGTGFDTDMYPVSPGINTDYRAMVTDSLGGIDSSNVVSITVTQVPVPVGVNASRCGIGPIALSASGIGLTTWYADSMAMMSIYEGDTFNTSINETTTYYVSTIDTNSNGGAGSGTPTVLGGTFGATNGSTENAWNVINISGQDIQINTINFEWNLGTGNVDIVINPTGGNVANAASGAGWSTYESFINVTANGLNVATPITFVTPLLIPAGATFGIGFDVVSGSITNSYQTGNGTAWVSPEFQDANLIITEGAAGGPPGGGLGGFSPRNFWGNLEYQFANGFCESPRVPVIASITAPPPVTINVAPSNLICGTDTVSLSPQSANTGYTHTWFSPMHVDTIIGDSLVAIVPTSTTYTLFSDDGTCASLDSVNIDVGAPTTAGLASVQADSICAGYTIPLNLNGSAGVINWQFNNGSGWVTPGDSASMTSQYFVSPNINTDYRAVLSSGGCPSDTTNILSISTTSVGTPTGSATVICGSGNSTASASGGGNYYWYANATTAYVGATGSVTMISAVVDTTVYVAASSGETYNIGKASDFPGGLAQSIEPGKGLGFDVTESVTINRIYLYPFSSGDVEIVLRASQGGPIIASKTVAVTNGSADVAVDLDWIVYPGSGYRMEMGPSTTASLIRNTSGISYPINSPSGSLTITGFLNPGLSTGATYYYFFNWQVSDGCTGPRVPVSVIVLPAPTAPTISVAGNVLTSTSAVAYQWYQDSVLISGATMQSYTATSNGNYVVVVTDSNGCTNSSASVLINVGIEEFKAGIVNVYPNPVQDILQIAYSFNTRSDLSVRVFSTLGKLVINEAAQKMEGDGNYQLEVDRLSPGIYLVVLSVDDQLKSFRVYKE